MRITRRESIPGVEYSTHLAVVEAAETCAERSARHAIRGYLLDRTGLEERSERIKEELRTDGESSSSGKPEKVDRWSFDVSTAHFLPRVGMRYRVGEHSDVNLMLYGTGSVGLEYLRIRSTYTRVFAGYDSEDDRYDLQLRRSF